MPCEQINFAITDTMFVRLIILSHILTNFYSYPVKLEDCELALEELPLTPPKLKVCVPAEADEPEKNDSI